MYKTITLLCCILFAQKTWADQDKVNGIAQFSESLFINSALNIHSENETSFVREFTFGKSATHTFIVRTEEKGVSAPSGNLGHIPRADYRSYDISFVAVDRELGMEQVWPLQNISISGSANDKTIEIISPDKLVNTFEIMSQYAGVYEGILSMSDVYGDSDIDLYVDSIVSHNKNLISAHPNVLSSQDELFGISQTHVFVIRTAYFDNSEKEVRLPANNDVRGYCSLLVAIDVQTSEEKLWSLPCAIRINDRTEILSIDMVDPFQILSEYNAVYSNLIVPINYILDVTSKDVSVNSYNSYAISQEQIYSGMKASRDSILNTLHQQFPSSNTVSDEPDNTLFATADRCKLQSGMAYVFELLAEPIVLAKMDCSARGDDLSWADIDWTSKYFVMEEIIN